MLVARIVGVHTAHVRAAELAVTGKGNVERVVPLPAGAAAHVRAWMRHRGAEPGPLVCRMTAAGEPIPAARLHPTYLYQLVQQWARAAGLERFSPHDLRRTYAGDLLDAGADLPTVQALMGHASPDTTSAYDRRGARARVAAASLLRVPE